LNFGWLVISRTTSSDGDRPGGVGDGRRDAEEGDDGNE